MRKFFLPLAVLVILIVGAMAYVHYKHDKQAGVMPTASPLTTIIHYAPTKSDIKGLAVESGSCWTNSIAIPYRSDAWRCMVGDAISDPCFSIAGSDSSVMCNPDPSGALATKPFVLSLTSPLPDPNSNIDPEAQTTGWLIKLSDGTVCTPFTGTQTIMQDGTVATYGCNNKNEDTIFGDLVDDGSGIWTATVGTISTPQNSNDLPSILSSSQVNVQTVWQ
jgi:hypothetical protein